MKKVEIELIEGPCEVDWRTLHQFLNETYAFMAKRIDPPSSLLQMTSEDLQEKAEREILLLAFVRDDIVGCMFCRPETNKLYLGKVAVHRSLQGQGIGRQMFEKAFEIASRLKLETLELETRVELAENHRTFEKLGFIKVSEEAHEGYDHATSITMRAQTSGKL